MMAILFTSKPSFNLTTIATTATETITVEEAHPNLRSRRKLGQGPPDNNDDDGGGEEIVAASVKSKLRSRWTTTAVIIWLLLLLFIILPVIYYTIQQRRIRTPLSADSGGVVNNNNNIQKVEIQYNNKEEKDVLLNVKEEQQQHDLLTEIVTKYTINNDERCHWVVHNEGGGRGNRRKSNAGAETSFASDNNINSDNNNPQLIGNDDKYNLGNICHYSYPIRYPPPNSYLNDIDHFHFRTNMSAAREQCFMDCIDILVQHNATHLIVNQLLVDASIMGLVRVVDKLLQADLNLDPLFVPTSTKEGMVLQWQARTNAIQRAIQGGYADIVKLLTKGNNNMVIDTKGRTVKDYINLKGSPIRPYFAKSILGLDVEEQHHAPPALRSRRLLKSTTTDNNNNNYINDIGDSGWNSYTKYKYDETKCDMDIVYDDDISKETFFQEYYIPGRPFVLRQASPVEEVQNFHKPRFESTQRFHPNNTSFKVGPTAYPSGTGQHRCPNKQSLLELEVATKCTDMPESSMVSGWHPTSEDLDELFPQYGGDILDANGGFRSIHNWFGRSNDNLGWQVFFGGDGSGATYHWHAAAFNILYVGIKEWRIAPPIYRGRTGMEARRAAQELDEHYTLQCVQQPGDQMFIPNYWGHLTMNHGFTIGAAAILNQKYQEGTHISTGLEQPQSSTNAQEATNTDTEQPRTMTKSKPHSNTSAQEKTMDTEQPPFLFVHINKTGGSSIIHMLRERCPTEYVSGKWGDKRQHRSFHATSHSYIEKYGRDIYDLAYTFAVVRHPLARQVSNFFFLAEKCGKDTNLCQTRRIPTHINGVTISEATDEQKIQAFHAWLEQMYQEYPPGSPEHYKFGSHGHGNEEYETFSATQTSWMVDPQGKLAVQKVYKLEDLSKDITELANAIPCLKSGDISMANDNITPKYPHYMLFSENANTKRIIQEVYAVDFENFGYEMR